MRFSLVLLFAAWAVPAGAQPTMPEKVSPAIEQKPGGLRPDQLADPAPRIGAAIRVLEPAGAPEILGISLVSGLARKDHALVTVIWWELKGNGYLDGHHQGTSLVLSYAMYELAPLRTRDVQKILDAIKPTPDAVQAALSVLSGLLERDEFRRCGGYQSLRETISVPPAQMQKLVPDHIGLEEANDNYKMAYVYAAIKLWANQKLTALEKHNLVCLYWRKEMTKELVDQVTKGEK
jgi:hypothetical protein